MASDALGRVHRFPHQINVRLIAVITTAIAIITFSAVFIAAPAQRCTWLAAQGRSPGGPWLHRPSSSHSDRPRLSPRFGEQFVQGNPKSISNCFGGLDPGVPGGRFDLLNGTEVDASLDRKGVLTPPLGVPQFLHSIGHVGDSSVYPGGRQASNGGFGRKFFGGNYSDGITGSRVPIHVIRGLLTHTPVRMPKCAHGFHQAPRGDFRPRHQGWARIEGLVPGSLGPRTQPPPSDHTEMGGRG
jgi:hypothetical protein